MKFLLLFLSMLIFISCDNTSEEEEEECKTNTDCKTEEVCNLDSKKCELPYIDNRWTYQSEPFEDIKLPYLFVNKGIEYNENNEPYETREIRLVDLEKREFVKTISFPYHINPPILKNSFNGKFYFYNPMQNQTDEQYGLMEINPKTGIIKQVSKDVKDGKMGEIADNGKVYYATQSACTVKDYPNLPSTQIAIYNPSTNKEKLVCIPSIISRLYKNLNSKIYASGRYDDVYIFEINTNDDSFREVFSGISAYGGWNIVSAMGPNIYYRIPYTQENKVSMDSINIKTGEKKNIPFSLSTHTDGTTTYADTGGFQIGDDLFVFTYRLNGIPNLVKYNTKTEEITWLYANFVNTFKTYYEKESNTVAIIDGVIFFVDNYEIKQFRGENYLIDEPVKKF